MTNDPWADLQDALIGSGASKKSAQSTVREIRRRVTKYKTERASLEIAPASLKDRSGRQTRAALNQAADLAADFEASLSKLPAPAAALFHDMARAYDADESSKDVTELLLELRAQVLVARMALRAAAKSVTVLKHRPPDLRAELLAFQCCHLWRGATKKWPKATMDPETGEHRAELFEVLGKVLPGEVSTKKFRNALKFAKLVDADSEAALGLSETNAQPRKNSRSPNAFGSR